MSRKQGSPRRAENGFRSYQLEYGSNRASAHSFRKLIERDDNPKCSVILELLFINGFGSLNREALLNQNFRIAWNPANILIAHTVNRVIFLTENSNSLIAVINLLNSFVQNYRLCVFISNARWAFLF